ncbi:nucleotidyltransferase family protein [uncultured Jatrophihabitans sp.]|uniref:nucleotidyltransferase family protein n=1 Tax=uncultured Jatrophihabitans sp. TaxID=1610747 RepID=UPI0035CB6491
MDLAAEADRLRLDRLAVQASEALAAAGVPHVLLKGPSTANWLYEPSRFYRDVDLLVAASRVEQAAAVLADAQLARRKGGRVGEEADHSLLLESAEGFEVDLHRSLPAVPVRGDTVWTVLAEHAEPLDLGIGTVPALDEPARCLVLALHAVGNPDSAGQPVEDLRRARAKAQPQSWPLAALLADALDVRDLFDAGVLLVDPTHVSAGASPRARLYAAQAPSGALALQRLAATPRRELPALLLRELVPTRGFMASYRGAPITGPLDLIRAHTARWCTLARELPASVRAWRAAHRAR